MAKRQAEELAVCLSQGFDAFCEQPLASTPEAGDGDKILMITADGKGIVMRRDALTEGVRKALARQQHQQTRISDSEKKDRTRMPPVVSVYEIAHYVHTSERILDPEYRPDETRPRPTNKRTWARMEADLKTVVEQGFDEEAVRGDPGQRMRWLVLVDGHENLLRQVYAAARRYKVEITVAQDFIHVLGSLRKAAHVLHPEAGKEREAWVKGRAHALLEDRAQDVAVGLRRAAARKQLDQGERSPVDKAADHIDG